MDLSNQELKRRAGLTRRYARYSRSLPGMGLALGGALFLAAIYLLPAIMEKAHGMDPLSRLLGRAWEGGVPVPVGLHLSPEAAHRQFAAEAQRDAGIRALLAPLALLAWVAGKEWIRNGYIRRHGLVLEPESPAWRILRMGLAVGLGGLAYAFPLSILAVQTWGTPLSSVQVAVGLLGILALPWATLRYIRGVQEALLWGLGSFLTLAMVYGSEIGVRSILPAGPLHALALGLWACSLAALLAGTLQHLGFLRLARELSGLEASHD